jgi:hypothetical protein
VERGVKVREGTVGVWSLEVQLEGRIAGCEAQVALQAGVRLHGWGVPARELVSKPFEGV